MQQRENTIRNIPWTEENTNIKGPVTILPMLEAATSTWVNVNVLNYTPGETEFNGNKFTGCTYNSELNTGDYKVKCETNTYENFGLRKARARMITAQEAGSTGCLVYKDGNTDNRKLGHSFDEYNRGSCPDWMHNYMNASAVLGGSYSDNTLNENNIHYAGYWTMSTNSNNATHVWAVNGGGYLANYESLNNNGFGARAVVEISKP